MRGVVGHVTSTSFWWGVATVIVALVLYRAYGSRIPNLPGARSA